MFKFTIVDKFMNNAPCKVLRVASPNDVQAEFQNDNREMFFDLVRLKMSYLAFNFFRLLHQDKAETHHCAFINVPFVRLFCQVLSKRLDCKNGFKLVFLELKMHRSCSRLTVTSKMRQSTCLRRWKCQQKFLSSNETQLIQ